MAEFEYDTAVAPYVTNFFGRMAADKRLSPQSRLRIQTDLLKGVGEIQEQRLKMQEQRDQGMLRSMRMQAGLLQMEETRRQIADQRRKAERSTALNTALRDTLNDNTLDPETKRQRIAAVALENADDDDVRTQAMFAMEALPTKEKKEELTFAQRLEIASRGVPREVLDSGDPELIGRSLAEQEQRDAQLRQQAKELEASRDQRKELFSKPIRFAKSENSFEPAKYLEDESHQAAKLMIRFGTPDEQKAFDQGDDIQRARIAQAIQVRELSKMLNEGAGGTEDRRSAVFKAVRSKPL